MLCIYPCIHYHAGGWLQDGKDDVQFMLVFKLSRFGRNAADVLNLLCRDTENIRFRLWARLRT